MTDVGRGTSQTTEPEATQRGMSRSVVIVLVVVLLFGGVFFVKSLTDRASVTTGTNGAAVPGTTPAAGGTSITSVHNDAVADYEAALKTGKPVYVLFHSLS